MKTKYLIAGAAAVAGFFYILTSHKQPLSTKATDRQKKRSIRGENHIRGIMNKSKLAI